MISPDITLVSRVAQTIREHQLIAVGDTVVVAFSGGADSTALLDILSKLSGYKLRLVAAHLNHALRGAEADADQEFCRDLASHYKIPFVTRCIDVNSRAREYRLSLEDAGRQARIEFLDEVRREFGAAAVALAHHADDQAETVLMRLLRGSGMTGLSGMAYRNARGYVRPLLDVTRLEIEQYLRGLGLNWREDSSNSDTKYLRNRIRHELLPLMEKYNPSIRSSLASTAAIIAGDEAFLDALTVQAAVGLWQKGEGRVIGSIAQLRATNTSLRRRLLRHAFRCLAGNLEQVSQRHIDALIHLIASDRPNAALSLPQGVTVLREYDRLVLMRSEKGDHYFADEVLIAGPGCYKLHSGASIIVEQEGAPFIPADAGSLCIDIDRMPFPWQLRTFLPGDRIRPFGMSGRKKVKDIFIDRKIPLFERKGIPLLFFGGELLWIAGICGSEASRVCAGTNRTVKVTFKRA